MRRTIMLRVQYDDDPERPRAFDLREQCNTIEAKWSRHLATDVAVWIEHDAIELPPPTGKRVLWVAE